MKKAVTGITVVTIILLFVVANVKQRYEENKRHEIEKSLEKMAYVAEKYANYYDRGLRDEAVLYGFLEENPSFSHEKAFDRQTELMGVERWYFKLSNKTLKAILNYRGKKQAYIKEYKKITDNLYDTVPNADVFDVLEGKIKGEFPRILTINIAP